LDDIWPDLIQTGSFAYFKDADPGSRWTYEFQGERNQIDHILISPSIKEIAKNGGIKPRVPDQPNRLASDHRPLCLRWTCARGGDSQLQARGPCGVRGEIDGCGARLDPA
jgi:hypothetical protein